MKAVGLLIAVLLLTACASTQEVQEKKTITIGVMTPVSGPAAVFGQAFVTGIEKAVQEENLSSVDIKIIVEDNKNDAKEGVNAYQRLSPQNPDLIITSFSPPSLAILPLVSEKGTPVLAALILTPIESMYNNSFRYFLTAQDDADAIVPFLKSRDVKTVGLYFVNTEGGINAVGPIREEMKRQGMQIVADEMFLPTETDHRTGIAKTIKNNPDAVYIFHIRPDQIVRDFKAAYDGIITFGEIPVFNGFYKDGSFDGTYAAAAAYALPGTPENARFTEVFGENGNGFSAFGYDLANAFLAHIKDDPDMSTIISRVASVNSYSGLTGVAPVNKEERHTNIPVFMVYIDNSTLIPVD